MRQLAIALAAMFFWACPNVSEDPFPPDPPQLVPKSLPEAWVEQGIDAVASGSPSILLMWVPNTESDLSGYTIYRADSTLNHRFYPVGNIDLISTFGSDTSYIDEAVGNYVDYYYFVTASDQAGNESAPSDTVKYRLMLPCFPLAPTDRIYNVNPLTFSWIDQVGEYTYTQEYVLRLDAMLPSPHTVWIARFYQIWYDSQTSGQPILFDWFPADGNRPDNVSACYSTVDSLEPGLYRWKIKNIAETDNATGLDECSNESEWMFFEIVGN